MKNIVLFTCSVLLLAGCGTFKPPWPMDSFQKVKSCQNEEFKITFFVTEPSVGNDNDIFTKELRIKINLGHEKYGKITIWLHYPKAEPPYERILPETLPEKIVILTNFGPMEKSPKDYFDTWKEIITPNGLSFVENCLYAKFWTRFIDRIFFAKIL